MRKNKLTIILHLLFAFHLGQSSIAESQDVIFQRNNGSTGVLSQLPIAGSASPTELVIGLVHPNSGAVVADENGDFIYSDVFSDQILKLKSSDKSVSTLVSSTAGLQGPQAISYDSQNKYLYIADHDNLRIVRVNLDGTLPKESLDIEIVTTSFASLLSDMKYNSSDNMLYWTDSGNFYRASMSSLPVTVPELLRAQSTYFFSYFDFDSSSPQNVYFTDSSINPGLYSASVPVSPNDMMTEQSLVDIDNKAGFIFISGVGVDKGSNAICYSLFPSDTITGKSTIECAQDKAQITSASTVFTNDTSDAPSYLIVGTFASKPTVVSPSTVPATPQITVSTSGKKPSAQVVLQEFTGAVLKSAATLEAKTKTPKIGFRYSVQISATTDADGNKLSKKNRDIRTLTSKKNTLTVKNLKTNASYTVKYKVEITSKLAGQELKVVKRTKFSPSAGFIVP